MEQAAARLFALADRFGKLPLLPVAEGFPGGKRPSHGGFGAIETRRPGGRIARGLQERTQDRQLFGGFPADLRRRPRVRRIASRR